MNRKNDKQIIIDRQIAPINELIEIFMITDQDIIQKLDKSGWGIFNVSNDDENLLEISNKLGKIAMHPNGNLIDYLSPKDKSKAVRNTFSYKFGFEEFPFHTDTAFWNIPARYVIMSSEYVSLTETLIISSDFIDVLNQDEVNTLIKSIFLVKTNNSNFYCSILSRQDGNLYLRFDPNCMKPVNSYAREAMEIIGEIIEKSLINRINWDEPKVLILDNWRTLHTRSSVYKQESRILKRIYIS